MENIVENNKLFAEFLDWEFDDLSETFETPFLQLVDSHAFGDEQYSCKLQDFELEFHSDWNWLMKVVEKIESLGYRIEIVKHICRIYLSNKETIIISENTPNIEAVYTACVEFIKWYNEQKQLS